MYDERKWGGRIVQFVGSYFLFPFKVVSVLLFLFGIIILSISFFQVSQYELSTGEVVAMREHEGDFEGTAPVIEFAVRDTAYTHESNTFFDPPRYQVGDQVELFYNPDDPSKAEIKNYTDQFFLPVLFLIVSIVTFIGYLVFSLFFKVIQRAVETGELERVDSPSQK